MIYTIGSLFSGIGGLDLAAHWAGFTTAWFVEREPFCQKVLANHWPGVPIHSDVFECHDLPHVDVIVGGFPCQPFSVAGSRKGTADERYLLPEMLRIIREVKPYAVLFENVPGFPSLNDGAEFKYLLRTLAEMGFDAEWGHLRASDCGAPHQRERWFCVAYAEGSRDSRSITDTLSQRQGIEIAIRRQLINARDESGEQMADMGDTSSPRLERGNGRKSTFRQRSRPGTRTTQSRFRGTPHGLPGWLDFAGWPARPGEDQYAYEPSRVTSTKSPDRAARLKALGNAVVPQVAYPLFQSIHEWLTEIKEVQS